MSYKVQFIRIFLSAFNDTTAVGLVTFSVYILPGSVLGSGLKKVLIFEIKVLKYK
jgi:hypothetical protein